MPTRRLSLLALTWALAILAACTPVTAPGTADAGAPSPSPAPTVPSPSPASSVLQPPSAAPVLMPRSAFGGYTSVGALTRSWALAWRWTGTGEPRPGAATDCDFTPYPFKLEGPDTLTWELPEDCRMVYTERARLRFDGDELVLEGTTQLHWHHAQPDDPRPSPEPLVIRLRWQADTQHFVGTRNGQPYWLVPHDGVCRSLLCK